MGFAGARRGSGTAAGRAAGGRPFRRASGVLDREAEAFVGRWETPGGGGLVARHGRGGYFTGSCVMEHEAGTPMRGDTTFRVASMSKIVTSVAVMMLNCVIKLPR